MSVCLSPVTTEKMVALLIVSVALTSFATFTPVTKMVQASVNGHVSSIVSYACDKGDIFLTSKLCVSSVTRHAVCGCASGQWQEKENGQK